MRVKTTWTIEFYSDDDKLNKLFEKSYRSVSEITKDFNIPSTFLYDCMRPRSKEKRQKGYNKSHINKYKRIRITKETHTEGEDNIISHFAI